MLHFQKASYLTSATTPKQLPVDSGKEVAFIGRSNAGKSSAINAITNIKGLARTSQSPGRTQMINFFQLDETHRLVDLPGYGFAKAPKNIQQKWEIMTRFYLEHRQSLTGFILVMDSRHPLKEMDQQMIEWVTGADVPLHILLTKADKLTASAQKQTLLSVQKAMTVFGDLLSIQLFSALRHNGVDEARMQLSKWLSS